MKDFVAAFLLPPFSLLILAVCGLFLARRNLRLGLRLTGASLLLSLAFCVPAIPKLLAWPLLVADGDLSALPPTGAAVFAPTGGSFEIGGGESWPSTASLRRVKRAWEIATARSLPLMVSGGTPDGEGPAEARTTVERLGIDPASVLLDGESRNSHENALAARALLSPKGISTLVLVSDASHLRRMAAALRHQGFTVVPANIDAAALRKLDAADLVPSNYGLGLTREVGLMYCGLAYYIVTGKIGLRDAFAN
ncbi:MAG: YdcF family protein [Alphaproteobacteria bacterium]